MRAFGTASVPSSTTMRPDMVTPPLKSRSTRYVSWPSTKVTGAETTGVRFVATARTTNRCAMPGSAAS
jgi:hypothetical protein